MLEQAELGGGRISQREEQLQAPLVALKLDINYERTEVGEIQDRPPIPRSSHLPQAPSGGDAGWGAYGT